MSETIAAISTPLGSGGIAIVRISGSDAILIANKIFRSATKELSNVATHTIHYGHIIDGQTQNVIDESLVSVMRAPKTFTGEDVVEINVHGSDISAKAVLDSLIFSGARLASAGEFTKRAFLNGKLDLAQAEAVIDIINSKTTPAHTNAVSQLEGRLSRKIDAIRSGLLNICAAIGVSADYTDEGFDEDGRQKILKAIKTAYNDICALIDTADYGKVIRNGILTAIIGSPNVGKSSLLNMLLGSDRAIVTDIAGTTRDAIEEYVNIGGLALRLADTAGIRHAHDSVEKIGIERSYAYIQNADLVIIVLDSNRPLDEQDREIFIASANKKRIIVLNKSDLKTKINIAELENIFNNETIISISTKNDFGASELIGEIKKMYMCGSVMQNNDDLIINSRHKESLIRAKEHLSFAIETLEIGECVDLIMIDLNDTISDLGEIVGLSISEEVVDRIFSQFCVGK